MQVFVEFANVSNDLTITLLNLMCHYEDALSAILKSPSPQKVEFFKWLQQQGRMAYFMISNK